MFRSLLVIILGGVLAWLIMRLTRTLKEGPMVRESKREATPLGGKKIIDAEFEDVDEDADSGGS
ncbi:MAG: hypothetical protein JSU61_03240 [Fidelibacterota bacterium]|nr:MAG: hypothetical protein JSU61_03240 [Candidatus Neomarinimicrobiota bacterium]